MKKKRILSLALCAAAAVLLLGNTLSAYAIEGTSYTYTISTDYSTMVPTMDAYYPAGTYLADIGLNSPEDMYYSDRRLYIADSGNHRILIYDLTTGAVDEFGAEDLKRPTGISIDSKGNIYVADYGTGQVVMFDPSRRVVKTIERPTEVYYGTSPFKPQKLDLDSYDNLFVLSEGTYEGIVQFDQNGNFNGFFGANKTRGLSLVEWFQKTFYTEEQKSRMTFRTPPNIVSLDVSVSDLVYTVTQNDRHNAIKKLNMAGVNIYKEDAFYGDNNFVDVSVLPTGGFYAITGSGKLFEYNENGELLLSFGSSANRTDRNGLSSVLSAVETDEDGNIYVLDKERNVIQVWYPAEYAGLLHKAEADYKAGYYEESLAEWGEILRMNPMAYMSHLGYGKSLFQLRRYSEAAEHFKLIDERGLYSDCFWEMRSAWLRSHIEGILIVVLILAALCFAAAFMNRKLHWRDKIGEHFDGLCRRAPLVKELTKDTFYFVRHPIDGVYYLKIRKIGSTRAASVLYVLALVVLLAGTGLRSFVFGGGYSYYSNPGAILLIALVPSGLFLVGSYLISAINDGEGSFRNVFVVFGYSLSAFIVLWPVLTALSHVFTLTEQFVYGLLSFLVVGYTGILVFISIKEVHSYDLGKTVTNILLTIFFMVVAILAAIVLFILWRELASFVSSVFEEVRYRAFS